MQYCLSSDTKDCRNCYKCIRHCPIKAISFKDDKASIIKEDCILCGRCYNVCPQNLKVIRNDLPKVRRLLQDNERVIASLAPSFISYYSGTDISGMRSALKKLGFYDAEETAVGATIVKNAYDEMLKEDRDIIISSCCHAINMLIKRHHPDCLPYLADVLSPMLAHGKDLKLRYGEDTKVVFIGPCIAKKDESDKNSSLVEAALTFEELDRWMDERGIIPAAAETPEYIEKSKARLFPTNGGILRTMKCESDQYQYLVCDGVENAVNTLKDIEAGKIHHCFIEMSSCQGSCVNGPLMAGRKQSIMAGTMMVNSFAGKEDFDCFKAERSDINTVYRKDYVNVKEPSPYEIDQMLKKMGKENMSARLNCGCCGYDSCEAKACAIIRGNANIEMCLPYLMEKAASLSDKIVSNTPNGLMVLDNDLNIQLINRPMCRIVGSVSPEAVIGTQVTAILDPFDYLDALQGERVFMKKEYLSEYDKYVENTVVYDEKFNVLICEMRDITKAEQDALKEKEMADKTLAITDEVIERNMKTVHEIASLLGETAAETKVALMALKETIRNEK